MSTISFVTYSKSGDVSKYCQTIPHTVSVFTFLSFTGLETASSEDFPTNSPVRRAGPRVRSLGPSGRTLTAEPTSGGEPECSKGDDILPLLVREHPLVLLIVSILCI